MAAVFPTLGPIEHYVRAYGNSSWSYLGTSLTSPEVEEEVMLLPLINDLGGRSVPMDYVRDRRRTFVSTTLSRFNRTTLRLLRGDTVITASAADAGEGPLFNGAPTLEYSSFELLLVNSYGNTYASADSPVGRCYYISIPRKFREDSQATRSQQQSILFECISEFDPVSRTFALFTESPSYWGVVTPE